MKNILFSVFIFILAGFYNLSYGQQKFIRELTYETSKDELYGDARAAAINEIKRALSDELGSYIVSQTKMDIYSSTEKFEQKFINNTQSLSLALMKVKILEEKRKAKSLYLKTEIEVDDKQLNKDLSLNENSGKSQLLQKVFEILKKNNAGAVSIIVAKNTDDLLEGLVKMENSTTGESVENIGINTISQILSGEELLNGDFRITYNDGYSVFSLKNGYIDGLYQLFDKNDKLRIKGFLEMNKETGTWELWYYKHGQHVLYESIEFKNGKKDGKNIKYKKNKVAQVMHFSEGIPIYAEEHTTGSTVYSGKVDDFEKKTGKWIGRQGEKIVSSTEYINNVKEGPFTNYYENGEVYNTGTYRNNRLFGEYKEYYNNKKLKIATTYDAKGETKGNYVSYFENGNIEKKHTVLKDGRIHIQKYYRNGQLSYDNYFIISSMKNNGYSQSFYENGQVKESLTYLNGKKNGEHKKYSENGILRYSYSFKNDIKDGVCNTYLKNGKPRLLENYKAGVLNGEQKKYDESGTLLKHYNYMNGKPDGECMKYDASRGKTTHYIYKNQRVIYEKTINKDGAYTEKDFPFEGKPGTVKTFYQNGQLKEIKQYKAPDEKDAKYYTSSIIGERKSYSRTGVLLKFYNWQDGKKHGLAKEYFDNGEIKQIAVYENGKRHGFYASFKKSTTNNPARLSMIGQNNKGKRTGTWKVFLSSNKVTETVYDEYGKKQSSRNYVDEGGLYNAEQKCVKYLE